MKKEYNPYFEIALKISKAYGKKVTEIRKLRKENEELKNQLRIRGDQLKATENKVAELYSRLEDKETIIEIVSEEYNKIEAEIKRLKQVYKPDFDNVNLED